MSTHALDARRGGLPSSSGLLVGLLAAAVLLSYVDRGLLAVAGPLLKEELGLSATAFGLAVSAFFWVYAPGQLLCGWMVDRFPVQRLFGGGLALWGAATALTAVAGGVVSLVALRLLLGLGQSFIFPGSSKMLAQHCRPEQRGAANGAIMAGLAIGQASGAFVGGLIMAAFGWRAMCIILGLVTLVWLWPWRLVRNIRPIATGNAGAGAVSFKDLLSHWAVWSSAIAHFCNNYGFYFLITWLPLYLVSERGASIEYMAALIGLVFAVQAVASLLISAWSDRLMARGADEGRVRKTMMVVANIAKATGIAGIALVESQLAVTAWLIAVAIATGATSVQNFAIPQTFAGPCAAGRWVGVQNFGGNLAGIVGPVVTGMLVDATGDYQIAFILAAAMTLGSALFWAPLLPRIAPIMWRDAGARQA